jgi:hypothetical protein
LSGIKYERKCLHQIECGYISANQARYIPMKVISFIVALNLPLRWINPPTPKQALNPGKVTQKQNPHHY